MGHNARVVAASWQQKWWVEPSGGRYTVGNIGIAFLLRGVLLQDCLVEAIGKLVNRREALRVSLRVTAAGIDQVISPPWTESDVQKAIKRYTVKSQSAVLRLLQADLAKPWDLWKPLFRCLLLRISSEETALGLLMSHAIADGHSIRVMSSDFVELYRAVVAHDTPNLPARRRTYVDCLTTPGAPTDPLRAAYWRGRFAEPAIPVAYPWSKPQGGEKTRRYILHELRSLPAATTLKLARVAKKSRASLAMALIACTVMLVERYSHKDVVVAVYTAGRTPENNHVVGFLANVLLLRIAVDPDDDYVSLLRRVRDAQRGAYDNALPLDAVAPDGLIGGSAPGLPAHADISVNFDFHSPLPCVKSTDCAGRPYELEGVYVNDPAGALRPIETPRRSSSLVLGNSKRHRLTTPVQFFLRSNAKGAVHGFVLTDERTVGVQGGRCLAASFEEAVQNAASLAR